MKLRNIAIAFSVLATLGMSSAQAATNCAGKVKFILKWNAQCDGNIAYQLEDGSEKFLCTSDKVDAAMVLTAQASGATVIARLSDSSLTSCTQNAVQYTTPTYIALSE